MIDKTSPIPIYFQIQEEIRKKIREREWKTGEAIPSERVLSELFEVSRMTVRQAVQGLVDEGILMRKRGSGTFVSEHKVEQPLEGRMSFTRLMEERGMKASNKIVAFLEREASVQEMEALALEEPEHVLHIERLRYGDEIPIVFESIITPTRISAGLTEEKLNRSFYQFLEREKGLRLGKGVQTIEAVAASARLAKLLKVDPGSPVLSIERVTSLSDGTPFEYVKAQYAGSRFKFYM